MTLNVESETEYEDLLSLWADLEAGSPLPKKQGRTEAFILGSYPQGYRRAHRFTERVRAARAAGYSGPVLYVKAEVASSPVFHPVFDPEHGFEGHVDLRGATLEREFVEGPDRIAIYAIR